MLKCSLCKMEKVEDDFHLNTKSPRGRSYICKECKKKHGVEWNRSTKMKAYYADPDYKERKKQYQIDKSNEDIRMVMYINTKHRAKKSGIPFDLTLDDLIIPETCPILEIPLLKTPYGERKGFQMNSPSIDKIIPELGYVKGNIQIISMKANAMKYSATKDELVRFCTNVLKQISDGNMDSKV